MSYTSPLLDRARKESTRNSFSIPRRGRIRLILLLVLCGLGGWWHFVYRQSSPANKDESTPQKDSVVTSVKSAAQKKKSKTVTKDKPEKKVSLKHTKKLTYADVENLLRKIPPRLSHAVDTIHLKNDGYIIHYSIDTALQRSGREYFRRYHPKYGALVVMEPVSGRILSLVSYTNDGEVSLGRNLYCRSLFPAASIFKTIAAAGAIEKNGLHPDSKLKTHGRNHTLYNSQLKKNLDTYREITLKEAYAYSINPVFGRIGIYMLGADGLNEYAVKFGFNSDVPFELDNEKPLFIYPDSAFAVAEVASGFNRRTTISPLFGAMIAACISSKGRIFAPTLVDSITNLKSRRKIYTRKRVLWRMPIQEETADLLVELMRDVTRYGTSRKSFRYLKKSFRFKDIDYGGKTGSIDKEGMGKVDWFIGFSRHKDDATQHIAVAVLTVHGDYWTVHSSFVGAEIMRKYIRKIQIARKTAQDGKPDSPPTVKKVSKNSRTSANG